MAQTRDSRLFEPSQVHLSFLEMEVMDHEGESIQKQQIQGQTVGIETPVKPMVLKTKATMRRMMIEDL